MNNGVRSTWRAFTSGTREGAKPRDKSSATRSHKLVDRPDLVPMVTKRNLRMDRECQQVKWLIHLTQKGWCQVLPDGLWRYVVPSAPGLQQAPKGTSIRRASRNLGSPIPPCLFGGRENASVWEGWHRRRSSPTPGCSGLDMVQDRQEKEKGRQDDPCTLRGHRRELCT